MKIIEAMKSIKSLQAKVDDLIQKIANHSADLAHETSKYPDQKQQVAEWVQSAEATIMEISHLKLQIQKTNIATPVTIELGGTKVTKSIAEWVHRRHGLTDTHTRIWAALTDRNLREGVLTQSNGEKMDVKIRRHYDPAMKDSKLDMLRNEPFTIDSTLEVVNATTDLVA